MQKLSFLPDISLFTPISIDTFFHLCANESVICRFLLFLFFIPSKYLRQIFQDHRNRSAKTPDTFKKIKKLKIYTTLSTKKKKNNDFWSLWFFGRLEYRNHCTLNERITRNHCLGNAKPHQLVHNTPKKRRIEGRARGEFWSCRFHLGEREHDVSVHCCEQPSGRDTIKLEIFNGFIILPQLGRKYTTNIWPNEMKFQREWAVNELLLRVFNSYRSSITR